MCRSREGGGGQGVRTPPLKNHKNIGFLSNTDLDPLKNHKLLSQHSIMGHHWHASKTPFKWRFSDGPMMALNKWYMYLDPLINKKNKNIKVGPPLKTFLVPCMDSISAKHSIHNLVL